MTYTHKWLTDEESESIRKKYDTDLISPIRPADVATDGKARIIGLMVGRGDGVPYVSLAIIDGREIAVEYDLVAHGSEHKPDVTTWRVTDVYASPNQSSETSAEIHDFMRKNKKQILDQVAALVVALETKAHSTAKKAECLIAESLIR